MNHNYDIINDAYGSRIKIEFQIWSWNEKILVVSKWSSTEPFNEGYLVLSEEERSIFW